MRGSIADQVTAKESLFGFSGTTGIYYNIWVRLQAFLSFFQLFAFRGPPRNLAEVSA